MKKNWKNVLLYIVRIIELLITGAAGGALGSGLWCTALPTRRAVPCERRTLTATIVHWAGSAVVTTM